MRLAARAGITRRPESGPRVIKGAALGAIRFYQRTISPTLPAGCRFQPTCSHYSYDAIQKHGIFKGVALTAWRLLRCNPFNHGGVDPVP